MRMDPGTNTLNAAEVLNTYTEADLARILRIYGEEKFARQIAREIVRRRQVAPLATTGDFVDVIKPAFRPRRADTGGIPPSAASSHPHRGQP